VTTCSSQTSVRSRVEKVTSAGPLPTPPRSAIAVEAITIAAPTSA
jgi:hypothetical protein